MKRLFLAAAAAFTVGLAASPALAQPYGDQGYGHRDWHNDQGAGEHDRGGGWSLDQRVSWLQNRIYQARRNGDEVVASLLVVSGLHLQLQVVPHRRINLSVDAGEIPEKLEMKTMVTDVRLVRADIERGV